MDKIISNAINTDFITMMLVMLIGFIIRDLIVSLANGLMFYFNKTFNIGDYVWLDGDVAIIISIGISQTIFEVEDKDGKKVWLYIHNSQLSKTRLGKIKDRK